MPYPAFADGDLSIDSELLNSKIEEYCSERGINADNIAVGYIYTATGDSYYFNGDEFFYSASLYKVPCCMLLAEKEAAGEITPDSDCLGYTAEYLERTAIVDSNNTTGHAVIEYIKGADYDESVDYSGKCTDMITKYASMEESYYPDAFFKYSYYSARFMTEVLNTLYKGGDEAFPHIIDYMKQALPQNYFNLTLGDRYTVAQKYGALTENDGTDNNHCAAIVYTPNPVCMTVMTRNVSNYENVIADMGEMLAEYTLVYDSAVEEYNSRPSPTPEPTPEPTEEPTAEPEPVVTPQPETTEKINILPLVLGAGAVIIVAVAAAAVKKGRKKPEKTPKQQKKNKTKDTYIPKH